MVTVPMVLVTYGSNAWSLIVNPQDFALFGVSDGTRRVYQIHPAGFTACRAPRWDVAGMKELPFAGGPRLPKFTRSEFPLLVPAGFHRKVARCILHPSSFPKFNAAQGHNWRWTL